MGRYAPDGLALTVALEPSIMCKADRHHAQVESCGQHTHGQTTVDWNDRTDQAPAHAPCAVNLVLKLDKERLRELMQAACT